MNDLEYIEQFGSPSFPIFKPDGEKKHVHIDGVFHHINDGLTRSFDSFFGPDEVDSFDASCNTCKNFQRKAMTPEEKKDRNLFGMPGHCVKKDTPVRGWQRGQFCGFDNAGCYENRRTGMRHSESCRPQAAKESDNDP